MELFLVKQVFGDRGLTVDLAVIESSALEHTVVGKILLHSGETVGFVVVEAHVHSGMTVGSDVVGLTRFGINCCNVTVSNSSRIRMYFVMFVMVKQFFGASNFFCLYFIFFGDLNCGRSFMLLAIMYSTIQSHLQS